MPLYLSDMPTITLDEDFVEVMECDYKGEHYSVRDNGAIMRHSNGRKRPNDGQWTFGRKDPESGYMRFRNEAVHRIVATAFHGEAPSPQHVVDHIDTNHCNNRPTNLRWLTKLENILLNDITRAKVIHICGSIEAFLANPNLLFGHESEDPNFTWMRAVTHEEAANTLANIEKLQHKTPSNSGTQKGMGNWVYNQHPEDWHPDFSDRVNPNISSSEPEKPHKPETVSDLKFTGGDIKGTWDIEKSWANFDEKPPVETKENCEEQPTLDCYKTSNELAVQHGWAPYTKPEFPCCPTKVSDNPLQDYFNNLEEGKPFVVATYGPSTVYKFVIYEDILLVVTKTPNGVKSFAFAKIYWNGEVFIHKSERTYFDENGVMADYTRAQGLEWDGPESIDDDC